MCKNGKCAQCIPGYRPASDDSGKCVRNCMLPCSTCLDGQITVCTSCFLGSILNGTTCVIDLSCNTLMNCTDCGQGKSLILVGATCIKCPDMQNCIQCSRINSQLCTICALGYYLKDNACLKC